MAVPSGFFYFAENCTLSENEHFASFSFFMPEHGKGGLFFNAPDGHGNRKEKQNNEYSRQDQGTGSDAQPAPARLL